MIKVWQLLKQIVNFAHKAIMCVLHLKQLFTKRNRKLLGLKTLWASIMS